MISLVDIVHYLKGHNMMFVVACIVLVIGCYLVGPHSCCGGLVGRLPMFCIVLCGGMF